MKQNNPYEPPADNARVKKEDRIYSKINSLDVSDKWKERFRAIARAGGPLLPDRKNLPMSDKFKAPGFNIIAFILGPIYYVAKGMWKKAIALLLILFSLFMVIGLVLELCGYGEYVRILNYGVSAYFGARANMDYYKKMVLNDNGWL